MERPAPGRAGLNPARSPSRVFSWYCGSAFLDLADVRGLEALRSLHDLELDHVTLVEGAKAGHLDGRVVDENIVPVLLRDETEALGLIEPLHGTARHAQLLLFFLLVHAGSSV